MPGTPIWLQQLVSWVTHWFVRGETDTQILARFSQRFRDLRQETYWQAWREAQLSAQAAIRANGLDLDDTLRNALGGEDPIFDLVGVRALVDFTLPDGSTMTRSIRKNFGWDTNMAVVRSELERMARLLGIRYEAKVAAINIIPPFRYPLAERLP